MPTYDISTGYLARQGPRAAEYHRRLSTVTAVKVVEPEPAEEEGEPEAFSISVTSVTGAESFAVRADDTLRSLQLRIAESKLQAPWEQQRLVLDGQTLVEDMDTSGTLASHGITGPVSLILSPQDAGAKLRAALQVEAEASLRAAIEPCSRPTRMKLRKADGSHKHWRWFWLTVEGDGQQIWVHWSANEDKSDSWQCFRSTPPNQQRVMAMREGNEGRLRLGLTMEVEGGEPVIVVAQSREQRLAWLAAWRAAGLVKTRRAAGVEAVEAGETTLDGVKASQERKEREELARQAAAVETDAVGAGYLTVAESDGVRRLEFRPCYDLEWRVPPGVTTATIEATGAQGGDDDRTGNKSGRGARVRDVFALVPGTALYLQVGYGGGRGSRPTQAVYADGSPLLVAEAGRGAYSGVKQEVRRDGYGAEIRSTPYSVSGRDASLSSGSKLAPRREGRERDGRMVITYIC